MKIGNRKRNNKWLRGILCVSLILNFHFPIFNSAHAQQSKHVLFIGNSYTQVNNLPQMVADVAASMGDTLTYEANTPGGCTFSQHCTNQSMAFIRQGGWDAVVLQEQSQYPSFPQSQVENEVYPYAQRLVDSIYAHGWCTEPMFYMTWGRENGDQQNAQYFPVLGTYEGMDSMLCLRYMQMASDNDASVCPVGRVWRHLRENHGEISLYQSDGSHPSVAGSYAAACAFYTMLFHGDPEEITYGAGLDAATAQIIRSAVRRVVYDMMDTWQRVPPRVQVVEVDTLQYMTCSFALEFIDSDTVLCDWDDGTAEVFVPTTSNARHLYADTGNYTITLTAIRHCLTATETKTFHASEESSEPQGIGDVEEKKEIISPNPASQTVRVTHPEAVAVELCSLDGRVLTTRTPQGFDCSFNLADLPAGVYLIRIVLPQGNVERKLIVTH